MINQKCLIFGLRNGSQFQLSSLNLIVVVLLSLKIMLFLIKYTKVKNNLILFLYFYWRLSKHQFQNHNTNNFNILVKQNLLRLVVMLLHTEIFSIKRKIYAVGRAVTILSLEREIQRFKSRGGQIRHRLPTARHCCNISSKEAVFPGAQ